MVEARINNLEQGMNTISTAIANINTQMEQIQKKLDEDRAKAAARVDDINKKWVAKQKTGDCQVAGGPPQPPQRAAAGVPNGVYPAAGEPPHTCGGPQHTRQKRPLSKDSCGTMGLCYLSNQRGSLSSKSSSNIF